MTSPELLAPGRLAGHHIGILLESDYVEPEIAYYQLRFAEEGAQVSLYTRLWGNDELTFSGHEYRAPLTVRGDLATLDYSALSQLSALIVPGGMVADRLRYSEDPDRLAPAVELMRRAFRLPNLVKGIICHGLWLLAPAADLVRGRAVTCHNNLVADVRLMGARYVGQDVVVDGDLVTGRSADRCHLFARAVIEQVVANRDRRGEPSDAS
jgi:protease I